MDRVFAMMDEDPEMGPRLQDADLPQRYEFTDVAIVVNIRARPRRARPATCTGSGPTTSTGSRAVRMTMSSEVANRYFQGKENVPIAIARRRIKTGGDVKAALALIPITKPVLRPVPRTGRARLSAPRCLSHGRQRVARRIDTARADARPRAT